MCKKVRKIDATVQTGLDEWIGESTTWSKCHLRVTHSCKLDSLHAGLGMQFIQAANHTTGYSTSYSYWQLCDSCWQGAPHNTNESQHTMNQDVISKANRSTSEGTQSLEGEIINLINEKRRSKSNDQDDAIIWIYWKISSGCLSDELVHGNGFKFVQILDSIDRKDAVKNEVELRQNSVCLTQTGIRSPDSPALFGK